MGSEGSVTGWIGQLRQGNTAAVQQLWERYFQRLVGVARRKLQGAPQASADEEDVALSAFHSFCRQAEQGHFPQLADRESLWRLLVVLTVRKAAHLRRDQSRRKRRGTAPAEEADLAQLLSQEPDPGFAAQMAEEYQRLLQRLDDDELRAVAVWKMEGYTVEEIAGRLNYAPRSIKRKLQLIRSIWEQETYP